MSKFKISDNYIILFKKSDFPLLNDGVNYEKDEEKWEYDTNQALLYDPESLVKSVGYRTWLFQVYATKEEFGEFFIVQPYDCDTKKRGLKDVRMYHRHALVDDINNGTLPFTLNDYYLYYGVEYL